MNRTFFIAVGIALIVSLSNALAAEPAATTARAVAPLDVVLCEQGKLARIQVRAEIDGQSLAAIWDETFARMFAFFDRNEGVIDAKETVYLPPPIALRQAMGSGQTPPVGTAPAFGVLDRNGDGKVTSDELASFYRLAGLGDVLIGIGRLPYSVELTDALLKQLDTDGDGRVAEREWKNAADILTKLDKNDDELIGAGELVPQVVYPGATGSVLLTSPTSDSSYSESLTKLPLLLLPADKPDSHWATEVVRRLGRDKDGKLSSSDVGFDEKVFAKLDADRDGSLTAAELVAWRQESCAQWVLQLSTKRERGNPFSLTAGLLRVEGWVAEGKMDDVVSSARKQLIQRLENPAADSGDAAGGSRRRGGDLSWLTPIADRNGDGNLDRSEFDAWLDLQTQIARGQVLLTVLDGGPALFELLDTVHDGALSVRELRASWDRVREAGCLKNGEFERANLPRVLLAAASRGYPQSLAIDQRRGPAWFQAMDRNGDGDVSRREFTGPASVFEKLDADKNSFLSAEEAASSAQ